MLIAILSFSGAILGATTIAGLLMLYQISATRDSGNSARAIFARCMGSQREQEPESVLGSGATVQVACYDSSGVATSTCSTTATAVSAVARGAYADAKRAFYLNFAGTLTMP